MSRRRSSPREEYVYSALDVMCPRGHLGGKVVVQEGQRAWDGLLEVTDRDGQIVDCWGSASAPPQPDARLRLRCPVCGADAQIRWQRVEEALGEVRASRTQHRRQLRLS